MSNPETTTSTPTAKETSVSTPQVRWVHSDIDQHCEGSRERSNECVYTNMLAECTLRYYGRVYLCLTTIAKREGKYIRIYVDELTAWPVVKKRLPDGIWFTILDAAFTKMHPGFMPPNWRHESIMRAPSGAIGRILL
jgi:hypothetical protein